MKNNQFNTALREITLEQLETVAHNPKNSEVGDTVLIQIYDLNTNKIVYAPYRVVDSTK